MPAVPGTAPTPLDAAIVRRHLTELAAAIGFNALAVARAGPLPEPHPQAYREFLATGFPADMDYLRDHPAARIDPTSRWPWARSVLVLAVQYDQGRPVTSDEYADGYPAPAGSRSGTGSALPAVAQTVARYAQGRDYHRLVENALRLFKDAVIATPDLGITHAHYHCDTGPVLERPWAQLAGLGWQAKHGLVIRPGVGSFCFLAEIMIDRELPPDTPATDHCGSCTRCIDICPTHAIVADRVVDPRRCISWMNIERRDPLMPAQAVDLHGWLFGCDMCQNVCPHNAKFAAAGDSAPVSPDGDSWPAQFANVPLNAPVSLPWYRNPDRPLRRILAPELWQMTPALAQLTWDRALALTEAEFDALKQGTALRRVPYANFIANARAAHAHWQATGSDAFPPSESPT